MEGNEKRSLTEFGVKIFKKLYPKLSPRRAQIQLQQTLREKEKFSQQEIDDILKNISNSRAPGYNGIDNIIVKVIYNSIPNLMIEFFNKCLELKCFLDPLKIGLVILFHTTDKDEHNTKSYRSITLQPKLDEILSVQWCQGVHIRAFAEDFAFIVTDNTREGPEKLRYFALNKFKDWTDKNELHVSMEKSSYVLLSKLVRGPTINWEKQPISRTDQLKYRGVTLDHKLGCLPHVLEKSKRAMEQYQHLCRIVRKNWEINKNIRRILYKTVIERTICHGEAAWGHNAIRHPD
ncbi:hypothetical protein AVEN_232041-1 [Araneus ventricosus]|uniref:Reverse transcriptase domain-containing protein n=1 Tax=Araneus ventricosus TaxID=182803 RepID=A0A4Y2EKW2_ARAVE|nr:hypothetical protein AVEN_232041-1 [Araneus ventricosus]